LFFSFCHDTKRNKKVKDKQMLPESSPGQAAVFARPRPLFHWGCVLLFKHWLVLGKDEDSASIQFFLHPLLSFALMQKKVTKKKSSPGECSAAGTATPPFPLRLRPVVLRLVMIGARGKTPLRAMRRC
jgi:hypothetical protein